ncbi:MAG: hypothetical protein ACFFE7_16295, partial [Candidatus Thorarchaeota archaeon]
MNDNFLEADTQNVKLFVAWTKEGNWMKTRLIQLIAGITMVVLCISVCTTNANAAVIWQDNFDDGNLDGWTIFGYPSMTDPTKTEGNFSASDFMLKVLDDDINCARNDSTVTEGTWSFDMFVPNGLFY